MDQGDDTDIIKIEPEPTPTTSISHNDKPKRHKRRRLRRLMEPRKHLRGKCISCWCTLRRVFLGTCVFATILAFLLSKFSAQHNNGNLFQDFLHSYRKHYNQIVHGHQDYCDAKLDTQALFARLQQQSTILHQDGALQQLEIAFRNESRLNAIAVVGPSGVGKSLWARALEQQFPWQENVHSYAWNTFVPDEAEKFHVLRMFVGQISDCGRNLLVIDNLAPCDHEVVTILNSLLTKATQKSATAVTQVVVVYIFNLHTMEAAPNNAGYLQQYETLQKLPFTKTVNFQQFGIEEIKDCIRYEVAAENITLTSANFDEIVATIDVARAGCKNVHAKVLTLGKVEEKTLQGTTN